MFEEETVNLDDDDLAVQSNVAALYPLVPNLRACLVSRCVQIFEQIFQLTRRKAAGMLTHFKVFRRSSGEKSAEKM
ncbi:MAG: hypothetical protein J6K77_04885, partial [Ruminococcus sp.]|nr:hypothetical protein [Ruminococcus sp.]